MFFLNNDIYVPSINGGITALHTQVEAAYDDDYLRDFLIELSEYETLASDTDLFTA